MRSDPCLKIGSPGRTRTSDRVVNSHLLYQLSYRGSVLGTAGYVAKTCAAFQPIMTFFSKKFFSLTGDGMQPPSRP